MATITPTTTVSPTTMTANWTAGLQSPTNQAKLIAKYLAPKKFFNADPAGAQAAYSTGVTRVIAANKYASGMQNANVQQAANNMQQYGGANWSASGTSKAYKFAAVAPALASAISAVQQTVNAMPKGRGPANIARMNAWANGMMAYYGKIKA